MAGCIRDRTFLTGLIPVSAEEANSSTAEATVDNTAEMSPGNDDITKEVMRRSDQY